MRDHQCEVLEQVRSQRLLDKFLLHQFGQAGDQCVTGVNHRWEEKLLVLVKRVTKLREHHRVQRLVRLVFIHAFALQGLGFGFSFLERDGALAQSAELTNRR